MSYRILVTGSRDWDNIDAVVSAINAAIGNTADDEIVVVHGACPRGVDQITAEYCEAVAYIRRSEKRLTIETHPADWDNCAADCKPGHRVRKKPGDTLHPGKCDDFCPDAGPRRNAYMVSLGADICLAFPLPGSRGTRNCMRLARQAGIDVKPIAR